jgi:hypothetical protein
MEERIRSGESGYLICGAKRTVMILVAIMAFWGATVLPVSAQAPETLTRRSLQRLFVRVCQEGWREFRFQYWFKQLDNDHPIHSQGTLPAALTVREVALKCLELMLDEDVRLSRNWHAVTEIVGFSLHGEWTRAHIMTIDTNEVTEIKQVVQRMKANHLSPREKRL